VGNPWGGRPEALLIPGALPGTTRRAHMSRYDFIKDPKDREWLARWQLAAVVMRR
jgi:hypothetical protein